MRVKNIVGTLIVVLAAAAAVAAQTDFNKVCPTRKEPYCVQNKKTIEAAWVIAVGEELGPAEWEGMSQSMFNLNALSEEDFKAGLKLAYVTKYAVKYIGLFSPADGKRAVDNAFLEVHGRLPVIEQVKSWESKIKDGTAWYTTIVLAERKRLNDDAGLRAEMVQRAFAKVLGRAGKADEAAKWTPGTDGFRITVGAMRNWLYTPEGTKDQRDVCRRVLNYAHVKKTGQSYTPTDAEIDKLSKAATPQKMIHSELIAFVGL